MTFLLDGNVLIALVVAQHVHHEFVIEWFAHQTQPYATTPITQGTLLRFLLRTGADSAIAIELLEDITTHERHRFWADDRAFSEQTLRGVVGHRQVTDAYLAGLARANGGRLATLDRGIAALQPDVATLIPVKASQPQDE